MSSRFFVPPEQITHKRFVILGSEAHHAARVLRKKVGDSIDLFDGKDLSYHGRIESITPDRVEGVILAEEKEEGEGAELVLYQALIKGPKWDYLLEKACEIGVTKVVPLLSVRTVVKMASGEVRERWQRIALAASKQSGRARVMDIGPVIRVEDAIREPAKDILSLIPWEKENAKTVRQACEGFKGKRARVFIGPEGGWDGTEVRHAQDAGIISVRLGPTLLRSETAGLVASTLVLTELGVYS